MAPTKPLPALVQSFFSVALPERGFSRLTVLSYRDAMKLFLRHAAEQTGKPVVKLRFEHMSKEMVTDFLTHLESDRGNRVSTRNNRLAALRTFFSYVAAEEPSLIEQCRRICKIPLKKTPEQAVSYLEQDELDALLAAPDRTTRLGRAHYAILLFLYNTGARVAEAVALVAGNLRLEGANQQVTLWGKGSKERICPLWTDSAQVLRDHLAELGTTAADQRVFLNRRGYPLTRFGVNYIVTKYATAAADAVPSIGDKRVSPHTIRHSTAVHMLNAGVNINVIRVWLGHVNLQTTNIYAEINLATKRRVLEMCASKARPGGRPTGKKSTNILTWLEAM